MNKRHNNKKKKRKDKRKSMTIRKIYGKRVLAAQEKLERVRAKKFKELNDKLDAGERDIAKDRDSTSIG